jgi:hypothetical protein
MVSDPVGAMLQAFDQSVITFHTKQDVTIDGIELFAQINATAIIYWRQSGQSGELVVTDGTRDARDQASRMYEKLNSGGDLSEYKAKGLANNLKAIYNANKGKASKDVIIDKMTDEIVRASNEGINISSHVAGTAFDLSDKDTEGHPVDLPLLRRIAAGLTPSYVVLEEFTPVHHYHLQPGHP